MNIGSTLLGGFFGGPMGALGGAIGGGKGALLGSLFGNMGLGGGSPFMGFMGNGFMGHSMGCMPSWGGYSPYGMSGFGMGGFPMMGRGCW